jgi:hypothetical protein
MQLDAEMPEPPKVNWGAQVLICVRRCPTFPPGLGSIIGAGRLSFRVRDGSGRFPAAMAAVTLVHTCGVGVCLVVGCRGLICVEFVVAGNVPIHHFVCW